MKTVPTPERPYRPIDCGFYDELVLRAMHRSRARVVYRQGAREAVVEGVLEDIYSEGDAEYLRLDEGTVIRLDHLVSVDGLPLPTAC
jgi:Rho-binding antiterminator